MRFLSCKCLMVRSFGGDNPSLYPSSSFSLPFSPSLSLSHSFSLFCIFRILCSDNVWRLNYISSDKQSENILEKGSELMNHVLSRTAESQDPWLGSRAWQSALMEATGSSPSRSLSHLAEAGGGRQRSHGDEKLKRRKNCDIITRK